MTKGNRAIAAKLRELARDRDDYDIGPSLEALADTMDPPRPEPGTVVWWPDYTNHMWRLGIVSECGKGINTCDGFIEWGITEWKPARILGPRQVAVDILPTWRWPQGATKASLRWHPETDSKFFMTDYAGIEITREEAERMEAEDA